MDEGETLVERPARASAPTVGSAHAGDGQPERGDSVGRFVILGVLGQGGMGVVYTAYDPHLDRKVAIKLLGAAAKQILGDDARVRLLREAQAMAKIKHPNVITVHELGEHGNQVFVAMEFADAGTVKQWLAKDKRTCAEIVDVFAAAGRGLAAAHAAGLVHRDFKPDNVLMTRAGEIMVTDFGLVGVAEHPDGRPPTNPPIALSPDSEQLTQTGSVMGTPTYMAPEQFAGEATTPRTDQFAFCIALYEALYGERPFAGTSYLELSTSVLEGKIAPPSRTDVPARIRRVLVRGLSKDPAMRYPEMTDLLADLTHERSPRHVIALGAIGACVVGGIAALIATRAHAGSTCQTDRADAVWNEGARVSIAAALTASKRPHAAATADRVSTVIDTWTRAWQDAYTSACEATRVRGEQSEHLLDLRMECLSRRLDDLQATVTTLEAGGPDVADRALSAVLALPSVAPCSDTTWLTAAVAPPETADGKRSVAAIETQLASARAKLRLARFTDALAIANDALAAARKLGYRPAIASALLAVGVIQHELADPATPDTLRDAMDVAAAAGDRATEIDAAATLVHHLATQTDKFELAQMIAGIADAEVENRPPPAELRVKLDDAAAVLAWSRGKYDEATKRYEHALGIARKEIGDDSESALSAMHGLGVVLKTEGKFAESRAYLEKVVASRERLFGKDHPDVAAGLNDLANTYRMEGKLDDAKKLYERVLAIRIAGQGPDHPEVGTAYNNLGIVYSELNAPDKAQQLYEKALAIYERVYGKEHYDLAGTLANLGTVSEARGDYPTARAYYQRALAITEAAKGKEHPEVAGTLSNLGNLELRAKNFDEAIRLYDRAEHIAEAAFGPNHPDVADYLVNLEGAYASAGKLPQAKELMGHVLAVTAKAYGNDAPQLGAALVNYGNLQARLKDYAGAIETYNRALKILEAKVGKDHLWVSFALDGIGSALVETNRGAEAIPVLERALAIRTAGHAEPLDVAGVRYNLAQALAAVPASRARALAEGKASADEYAKAGDADKAREISAWVASQTRGR